MKIFKTLLFLLFTFSLTTVNAQDIHYSLFNMSPMTLNPALTGAFSGTARIGGLYRNQAFSVANLQEYNTPSVYIDAPILKGFRKGDWIGVGLVFVSDKVGILEMTTNRIELSASYHLALNKKGTSILTLGLQGGSVSRRFSPDLAGVNLSEIFDISRGGLGHGTPSDPLLMSAIDTSLNYTDYSGGLLLRTQLNKTTDLEVGFSAGHVTKPIYAFTTTVGTREQNKLPMRLSAHAKLEMALQGKWSIAPTVYWQGEAGANEILLQAWGGYQLNKDVKLNFGLGYRFGDALNVLLGADFKENLRVALAYDITLSELSNVNSYSGGVEIAAWYIIKKYKQPVIKPKVLCPRF